MTDRLASLGRALTPEQWLGASLCEGWRACDVYGHMTYGGATPLWRIGPTLLVRYRGNLHRGSAVESVRYADAHTQHDLIDRFVQATIKPIGIGKRIPPDELHLDHLIHELDIRRPAGIDGTIPPDELRLALETAITARTPLFAPAKRAAGLTIEATDVAWTAGSGPLVSGPAEDVLLALAGRPWTQLSGRGVEQLSR